MSPRTALLPLTIAMAVALAAPAAAGPTTTYKGKATSKDKTFRYGKVTMRVKDRRVTNLKIESVTTNGCAGVSAMNIVFSPSSKAQKIVGGSAKLSKSGRLVVSFRPDKTVEEQIVSIRATVKKSSASGVFESVGICTNEGRFTAKR
jgi:hypothetical protein